MNIQAEIRSGSDYDADFTAWLLEQAARLRARDAAALDWDNLAEEMESLGLNHQRELASRLQTIILHVVKLMLSHDDRPRAGWRVTILTQRDEIERLLAQSPSLRRRIPDLSNDLFDKARKRALMELEAYEPDRTADYRGSAQTLEPISPDLLLDEDWFPAPPAIE